MLLRTGTAPQHVALHVLTWQTAYMRNAVAAAYAQNMNVWRLVSDNGVAPLLGKATCDTVSGKVSMRAWPKLLKRSVHPGERLKLHAAKRSL